MVMLRKLWLKLRALWDDDAPDPRVIDWHTSEWADKEGRIPDEELARRFPFARQHSNGTGHE